MDYKRAWEALYGTLLDDQKQDYPLVMSCFSNTDKLEQERGRRKERNSIIDAMKILESYNR